MVHPLTPFEMCHVIEEGLFRSSPAARDLSDRLARSPPADFIEVRGRNERLGHAPEIVPIGTAESPMPGARGADTTLELGSHPPFRCSAVA